MALTGRSAAAGVGALSPRPRLRLPGRSVPPACAAPAAARSSAASSSAAAQHPSTRIALPWLAASQENRADARVQGDRLLWCLKRRPLQLPAVRSLPSPMLSSRRIAYSLHKEKGRFEEFNLPAQQKRMLRLLACPPWWPLLHRRSRTHGSRASAPGPLRGTRGTRNSSNGASGAERVVLEDLVDWD